ncbi:hypothetical protein HOY82DRAFT_615650 [Tuber indicum]|nr:hypothetical protein HOY82DRAFT_615650 [Tuber indicum]
MSTLLKITPFDGGNWDFRESVDEYLDNIESTTLSWELSVAPVSTQATDRSKIRLFCQNLERDGDARHCWYYFLPDASKKDYGRVVEEFKERYGVKASEASSLFTVEKETLSPV